MEETRKEYDWRRCDNLRWEAAGKSGRIKVCGKEVLLLRDTGILLFDGRMVDEMETILGFDVINGHLPDGFRIVPRDPSTFRDWQVGDVVSCQGLRYRVGLASGEIVIFFRHGHGATPPMTSEEAFRNGFRLLLTSYEKELAEEEEYAASENQKRRRTRPSGDISDISKRVMAYEPDPIDPTDVTQMRLVNQSRLGYIAGATEQRRIDIERAWRLVEKETSLSYEEFRTVMLSDDGE